MTLEEKIQLLHADSKFATAAIPRLGIPARQLSDGPHGVREEMGALNGRPAGRSDDFSTWLPVAVALGATWNPDLARQYGTVLGEEARARGKSVLLGPGVNIQRTPLGGRDFEYFSEDPFLTARTAVPWIKGIQSQEVAACVKHYALNNQEWERDTIDVEVDERALREIYLPAFEAAVKEAGVWTVMGAYNQVRGQHACHNGYLLNTILKGEWGFKGIVISDWNGTHDTRQAVFNGLDLEMGTERPYDQFYLARPSPRSRQPWSGAAAVARRQGSPKPARDVPDRSLRAADRGRDQHHRPPADGPAGRRGGHGAPEKRGRPVAARHRRMRSIAVIGENATRKQAHSGGSSEIRGPYEVTPLAGIVTRAGASLNVVYAQGYRTEART